MAGFLIPIRQFLTRFRMAESGVAAVEFALVLPLLLTLYIGSIEASRALSYDRRLTSAASALGDLVAQTKGNLTVTDLNDIFSAAEITVAPFDAANLAQVVTCVYVDAAGNATVVWSYGHNGGTAYNADDAFALPTEFTAVAKDMWVIVSEAQMTYQPLTNYIFPNGFNLHRTYYYVPRYGELIEVEA